MLKTYPYNREKAAAYAKKWAFERNPRYMRFDGIGGDCTSFVSQCRFEGGAVMNYAPDVGWYYSRSVERRALPLQFSDPQPFGGTICRTDRSRWDRNGRPDPARGCGRAMVSLAVRQRV